jgi:hypothetical protein
MFIASCTDKDARKEKRVAAFSKKNEKNFSPLDQVPSWYQHLCIRVEYMSRYRRIDRPASTGPHRPARIE